MRADIRGNLSAKCAASAGPGQGSGNEMLLDSASSKSQSLVGMEVERWMAGMRQDWRRAA
jgi:hypothetical protein